MIRSRQSKSARILLRRPGVLVLVMAAICASSILGAAGVARASTDSGTVATGAEAPGSSTPSHFDPPIPSQEERARVLNMGERPVAPRQVGFMLSGNQDDYDVTHYKLQLGFNITTQVVSGTVTITGRSLVPDLSRVDLDLHSAMNVSAASAGGSSVTFSHQGDFLLVFLDHSYGVDEEWQITVTYSGHPNAPSNTFVWTSVNSITQVWSLSEPEGARYWWPCKDRPDDKATAEMIYTVPSNYIATSNGLLTSTVDNGNGTKTYTWVENHPITTYLIPITAYPFSTFSQTYVPIGGGAMPIVYYVYPADLTKAQTSFSQMPAMIEFFAQKFGEYAFVDQKYGMTEFTWGGAMEHQGNTSYGRGLVNGNHQFDYIMSHELAHQWWGDAVSPYQWADVWLNEGFASYCEALWQEHLNGTAAYRTYITQNFFHSSWATAVYNPGASQLFGTTVYDKGAYVLHMLRHIIGDAAFFQTLRNWFQNHKYGVGDTAAFQAQAETTAGLAPGALDYFFQDFVYDIGMPKYFWGWSVADTGSGYRLYVFIQQGQVVGPTVRMPIDIDVTTASGTVRHVVFNDEQSQVYVFDLAQNPSAVGMDPDDWILKTRTQFQLPDEDGDGVPDFSDNCMTDPNAPQADLDQDGSGDVCDDDDDGDLVPDAVDCAPADPSAGRPQEIPGLAISASQISWTATSSSDSYDVTRGLVSALSSGHYGSCLIDGTTSTTVSDPQLPAPGAIFLYLVRGVDNGCGGPGSWGTDSNGNERVNTDPQACP